MTSTNVDAIKIYLDVAEGPHANYYTEQFRNDTRTPKKWGCVYTQSILDRDNKTNPFFKAFCTAVERTNKANISWGEGFCDFFKRKTVGALFRREEYEKNSGGTGWITRPFAFRTAEETRKITEIPKDKTLESQQPRDVYTTSTPPAAGNAFAAPPSPPPLSDDDLPF